MMMAWCGCLDGYLAIIMHYTVRTSIAIVLSEVVGL